MNEFPWHIIAPLNTLLLLVVGCLSWFWTRGGRAAILEEQLRSAEERAARAEEILSITQAKLHEHMVSDAASFARLEALTVESTRTSVASEVRFTSTVDNLNKRLDALAQRLDDIFKSIVSSRDRKLRED